MPAADDRVRFWPGFRRANKTGNGDDDPTLIEEVAACNRCGVILELAPNYAI
jgi:hypothetical protein